jgi:sigma-B regulation protein RsbU (phosphoserine phosphatase)
MPEISQEELDSLRASVEELSALNQIATKINISMSENDITQTILDSCLRRIPAQQGAVFLIDPKQREAEHFHTFVRAHSDSEHGTPYHLSESLVGWMIKNKGVLVIDSHDESTQLPGLDVKRLGINSLLSAPLMSRGKLIGVLSLFNKDGDGTFTDSDKRFLTIVGSQAAKVIENARLFQEQQRLIEFEKEMAIARDIQRRYLPSHDLFESRFELVGSYHPAREVAGDFYDIVPVSDSVVFFVLGDVSGKGTPAALLAAKAQAVLRSALSLRPDTPVDELTTHLYHQFADSVDPNQFLTAFLAIYDAPGGQLSFVNAGHLPPLHGTSDGEVRFINQGSPIIGVIPGLTYEAHSVELASGDTLLLYTDGVTECFAPDGEEYGMDRLKSFLCRSAVLPLEQIRDDLIHELTKFRETQVQSDDITLLSLRTREDGRP